MLDAFKNLFDRGEQDAKRTAREAEESVPWPDGMGMRDGGSGRATGRVSRHREQHFRRASGRFHDPETGEFEPGSPPPDLDRRVDRYRAKDGKFKKRSQDLYDEREEVRRDELWPWG